MIKNLKELMVKFADEQKCRDLLVQLRWNGTPVCPYCGSSKSYIIEGGKRFKCGDRTCYKKYSVTVGTVFHATNIPLSTWFPAMYLISANKKGISSIQLGKHLGVTQKTAWFMLHRIRESIKEKESPILGGIVEIDETYLGGSMSNKHYKIRKENKGRSNNKTPVLGMLERGGKAIAQVINSAGVDEVIPLITERVEFATQIVTDSSGLYHRLNKDYFHYKVNHDLDEYVRWKFHTNTVEGFFSHLKRSIYGCYHMVSPKHLQRYCDETSYRYNTRKMKDGERFTLSLQGIEGRLTYKQLVYGKSSQESQKTNQKEGE